MPLEFICPQVEQGPGVISSSGLTLTQHLRLRAQCSRIQCSVDCQMPRSAHPFHVTLVGQTACEAAERESRLGVYLQIDTSGEDAKSGVYHNDLDACLTLARHVRESCSALELKGLMTIGAPGDMECFDRLSACRDGVAAGLELEPQALELSMGMSGDYEEAIRRGSTNVRVGSTIFGARYYPNRS